MPPPRLHFSVLAHAVVVQGQQGFAGTDENICSFYGETSPLEETGVFICRKAPIFWGCRQTPSDVKSSPRKVGCY